MNEKKFPNARIFDPSRFMDDDYTLFESATTKNPDKLYSRSFVFGAGRRMCQGMHIAERSLFLAIARMLWAFEFDQVVDERGKPIIPDIDNLTQGLFVLPDTFQSLIKPRSERHAEMIKSAWVECEETLLDRDSKQWKKVPEGMAFSTYEPSKDTLMGEA